MIYGIGVDTVDLARFSQLLQKTAALKTRLFTPNEIDLPVASIAARFAAKEALVKAFGGSTIGDAQVTHLSWQDIEVPRVEGSRPRFSDTPGLMRMMRVAGVDRAHLSLTHDGGMATAFVVLETGVPTGE